MYRMMLLSAFLTCFICYQGFAKGSSEPPEKAAELEKSNSINTDIIKINEEIKKINEEIDRLKINSQAAVIQEPKINEPGKINDIKHVKNDGTNPDLLPAAANHDHEAGEISVTDEHYTGFFEYDMEDFEITLETREDAVYPDEETPVNAARSIIGHGLLKKDDVIAYLKKINKAWSSSNTGIIETYFSEAVFEGVNADIAIAQMLYWTNYLRNADRVKTNNLGGLDKLDGWDGSFPNSRGGMTAGIRAHIQHLKGYARETPKRETVDPRFDLAYAIGFNGITFNDLYKYWSADTRYGQNIEKILDELYKACGIRP